MKMPPSSSDDAGGARGQDGGVTGVDYVLDPQAPLASARAFVDRYHMKAGRRLLHHHRDDFFAWRGSHYSAVGESALRAGLYEFLDGAIRPGKKGGRFEPNRSKVTDVLDALKAVTHLPVEIRPPAWLDECSDPPAAEIIACGNGLLHLPTLDLLPHSASFFALNALPFPFEPEAPLSARWLAFLASLWPHDDEAIATLQEIFGYAIGADTRLQKLFLLVGPRRSGKGTIARVLTGLLGQENVVAPTFAGLAGNFGLAPLIGKTLAVISDARLGARTDQAAIAERLLSISGEDGLTVDRKHQSAWTGRLSTRFLILANELLRVGDASLALAGRFLVLVLQISFYGREDPRLADALLRELPSILNWSLIGWQRLNARGHFVQPASSADAVQQLEELGSPIAAFLREKCKVQAGRMVEIGQLFDAWQTWCRSQGRDRPGNAQAFGRDLRAALPGLKVIQPREKDEVGDAVRPRYYSGISLS